MKNSICLNMIVKNESHVIESTLENICKYLPITYYVISDTGSTDNTIEIINNFFKLKNINGEIFNDEWKDFGFNRSLALKHAYNKTDYLFIFDADDKFFGNFILCDKLNNDAYYFKFGNGVGYKRILLVNNRLEWEFIGVLHEYISCKTKKNNEIIESFIDGNYYVDSGKTGNRSTDPQKYHKDAIILENAFFDAEKNNQDIKVRYAFYCAQSYRDSNQKEKSIEWYKKRIELGGWEQEVYFSYLMVGKQYFELNNVEKAIHNWTLAFDIDNRYECHYEVISYYRKIGKFNLAYQFYKMIENHKPDLSNKLFVTIPIYKYLLNYELIIILYHVKKYDLATPIFNKLFLINEMDIHIKLSIVDNFYFYLNNITIDLKLIENYTFFIKNIFRTIKFTDNKHIENINKTIEYFTGFYRNNNVERLSFFDNNIKHLSLYKNKPYNKVNVFLSMTSCKRYNLFSKTINSLSICFKDIEKIDYFFCVDDNSSKDDRKKMLLNYPFFKYYFKKEDEKGHLNSMNIIWNKLNEIKPKYWIHLEDDWLFFRPDNYIERSINFIEKYKDKNVHQILFNKNYAETIFNYNMVGGEYVENNDFIIHIKDEDKLNGANCAYWPHYSFRPSVILVETILQLGNFDSDNTFFEREYANKYFEKGYKSAFFNEITSIHMGKLTNEKSTDVKNAYQLNNIEQFNESKKINIELLYEGKYMYIKNYDHFGDDIKYVDSLSIEQLIQLCDEDENIICFNNLGYLKHTVNIHNLMCFNDDNKGLYINTKRFEKKYNIKFNKT